MEISGSFATELRNKIYSNVIVKRIILVPSHRILDLSIFNPANRKRKTWYIPFLGWTAHGATFVFALAAQVSHRVWVNLAFCLLSAPPLVGVEKRCDRGHHISDYSSVAHIPQRDTRDTKSRSVSRML
ncbi:hypothetical protein V1505DRAFT_97610 [Lipomyces doorenjongii]